MGLNMNRQCFVGMMMAFLQYSLLLSLSSATDFYKLLGVSRKANQKEIKKAYRQKSLEFHPDKNKEEGAAEKFSEIARAYEVLSDDQLKQIYDTQGEEGLKRHQQMQSGGGGGGGDPFQDIFSHFGFNFGHGGGHREPGEQQTESVEIPLRMELKQLYKGEVLDVQYVREVLCTNWEECMRDDRDCQGPGVKMIQQQIAPGFFQQFQQNDPNCVARGKSWRSNCKACAKGKTNPEKIDLTIDITKGMRNGERITFEGVTDEKPGYKAGDLHYIIMEVPHDVFRREGDHLYMHQEIPLVDALVRESIP
jgi:DnaJ-class molecular chaperone